MAKGFKIADGYVEVHAEVDEDNVRRAARRAVGHFDDESRRELGKSGERGSGQWADGFFRGLFKTNHTLSRILPGWFEIAASPIMAFGFFLGLAFTGSFIAAVLSAGVMLAPALGFAALAAYLLRQNEKLKAEWDKTAKFASEAFTRAAQPMLQPFMAALGIIRAGIAQMEPILTSIFKQLAPVIAPLTEGLMAFTVNFLKGIEDAMPAIKEIMLAFAQELPDFGTAIGDFFRYMAENKETIVEGLRISFTIIQIGLQVLAFTLDTLTRQLVMTAKGWNYLTNIIYTAAMWLKDNVPAAFHAIVDFFKTAWTEAGEFFQNLWNNIVAFFQGIWNGILAFFQGIWNSIVLSFQVAWATFMAVLGLGLAVLQSIWDPFWNTFGGLFKAIWDLLVAIVRLAMAAITFVFSWGLELLRLGWEAFWNIFGPYFKAAWSGISSFFKGIWNDISTFFSNVLHAIHVIFNSVWGAISGIASSTGRSIFHSVQEAWNNILYATRAVWNAVWSVVSNAIGTVWNSVWSTLNNIVNFIHNLYNAMFNAAKRMIQGIVDGIAAMIGKVTEKINQLTQLIRDHLPGSPIKMGPLSGEHEPRRGGRKIAEMIAQGMAAGIPSVKAALEALVTPVAGVGRREEDVSATQEPALAGMNLTVNLNGVWDFADPGAADRIVGKIHDAIEEYKRGYGKP